MVRLPILNPFPGAASFLVETTASTQEEARILAGLGLPSGSLVAAEAQEAGRGRTAGRRWLSEPGKNLLFTIRLDPAYAGAPALPLRIGAALCRAVAEEAGRRGIALGEGRPRLKWPNDLLLGGRKAAGILCEAGSEGVYAGIGLNCNQLSFPEGLEGMATSLALEFGAEVERWPFLELFLRALKLGLEETDWRPGVEALLWRRGELVAFVPGLPGSAPALAGRLLGCDEGGALLLDSGGGRPRAYAAGELLPDPPPG